MPRLPTSLLLTTALLVLAAWPARAQVHIVADVDDLTVGETEIVVFRVQVTGARLSQVETPQPPEADGLALLHRIPTTSQRTTLVNGQLSSSITFAWRYRPYQQGQAHIRAAEIEAEGRVHRTAPITLDVVPDAQRQQTRRTAPLARFDPDDLFLRVVPAQTTAYRNEQVVVDYFLYYRPGYRPHGVRMADAWDAVGFWREDLEPDMRNQPSYTDVVNGVRYNRLLVKRVAVFPTRPGMLRIDSLRIHADVSLPNDDPFGSFLRSFDRGETVSITSPDVTIDVKPLPPAPAGFTGAVGTFRYHQTLGPDAATVGERVRWSLSVIGDGNLATLEAPTVTPPDAFEVFGPEPLETLSRNRNQLAGRKQFTYTLVPQRPGTFTLDAPAFVYFDPRTAQYQTLPGDRATLLVDGEALAPTASAAAAPLVLTTPSWRHPRPQALHQQPWVYAALTTPLLFLAGLALLLRRRQARTEDTAGQRAEQASPLARRHLAEAERLLLGDDTRAFYAALDRALTGFVTARFDAPTSSLDDAALDALLAQYQVGDATRRALPALRHRIALARYAPITPRHADMEHDLAATADLLARLDA